MRSTLKLNEIGLNLLKKKSDFLEIVHNLTTTTTKNNQPAIFRYHNLTMNLNTRFYFILIWKMEPFFFYSKRFCPISNIFLQINKYSTTKSGNKIQNFKSYNNQPFIKLNNFMNLYRFILYLKFLRFQIKQQQ